MPGKFMFTREEVLAAALDLVREQGIAAVTARKLGEKPGSSSKPIFSLFENMEDIPGRCHGSCSRIISKLSERGYDKRKISTL